MPDLVELFPKQARIDNPAEPAAVPMFFWKVDKLVNDMTEKAMEYLEKCQTRVGAPAWWKM